VGDFNTASGDSALFSNTMAPWPRISLPPLGTMASGPLGRQRPSTPEIWPAS
jgi:hypothetical protein